MNLTDSSIDRMSRRSAVSLLWGALAAITAGCGGGTNAVAEPAQQTLTTRAPGGGAPAPEPAPLPAPVSPPAPAPAPTTAAAIWQVPPIYLAAGKVDTFDLVNTLPSNVARGGVFAVATSSAALPSGITLTPAGVLVLKDTSPSTVNAVVFTYTEPN